MTESEVPTHDNHFRPHLADHECFDEFPGGLLAERAREVDNHDVIDPRIVQGIDAIIDRPEHCRRFLGMEYSQRMRIEGHRHDAPFACDRASLGDYRLVPSVDTIENADDRNALLHGRQPIRDSGGDLTPSRT